MNSFISNNNRTKFDSFVEKMKIVLNQLEDEDVFEAYLNADGKLWCEGVRGKKQFGTMKANEALLAMNILATMQNTRIAAESPWLECEIPSYGHRFSATIPPVSREPTFSIRKKASKLFTLDEYVNDGIMREEARMCLRSSILQKENILLVGGPGSGKTTMGNALMKEMADLDPNCRQLVIEKSRELIISCEDWESWELPHSLPNGESHPATMEKLLELSLRRTPGRIMLGETRGPEAAGLLLAWNAGQPGGFTTIHADNALLGLTKLEQYIGLSMKVNPNLIARTINIIVSLQKMTLRDENGNYAARRVEEILHVEGYIPETNRYHTTPLYQFSA